MSDTAYLILENGRVFKGKYFGKQAEVTGEIVFTTGMTGYLETLTDNSYFGQIIVQTFPLIGNYGVIPADFESPSVAASAYIVKSWCREPSNFRSEGDLGTFFKARGITGLYDIDTRALTKIIRENGVMNGRISPSASADMDALRSYRIRNAVAAVSSESAKCFGAENSGYTVALIDYGTKENILRELLRRNCRVWLLPHNSTAIDVQSVKPDGIVLSNGPGDPAENTDIINSLRGIVDLGIPMFGICLGHQLLALAHGFRTEKLKYGHRGANQPVKDLSTGKVYITSQNHGYAVVSADVDGTRARQFFININDGTCEGLEYTDIPAFSTQFHPEACGGPPDTSYLFDRFLGSMQGK